MTRRAAQAWHGRQRSVAKAPMAGTASSKARSTVHIRGCDAILLYSYRLSREHCRFRSDRRPTGAAESAPPVTAAQGYFAISQQCCESVVRPAIAYRGATSTAAGALLQGKGTEANGRERKGTQGNGREGKWAPKGDVDAARIRASPAMTMRTAGGASRSYALEAESAIESTLQAHTRAACVPAAISMRAACRGNGLQKERLGVRWSGMCRAGAGFASVCIMQERRAQTVRTE